MQQVPHNPPALVRVIYTTIRDCRDAGLDRLGQEQQAAAAIRTVRPDIDQRDALAMVYRVRPD